MNRLKCGKAKTGGEREEKAVEEVKGDTTGYKSAVEEPEVGYERSQNLYLVGFSMELLQQDTTTSPGASSLTSPSCPPPRLQHQLATKGSTETSFYLYIGPHHQLWCNRHKVFRSF